MPDQELDGVCTLKDQFQALYRVFRATQCGHGMCTKEVRLTPPGKLAGWRQAV